MGIEDLITSIRDSFPKSVEVYTRGSCVRFAQILKTVYPEGQILYNVCHAIFEYKGKYYDITGEVQKENHTPLESYGEEHVKRILELKYEN